MTSIAKFIPNHPSALLFIRPSTLFNHFTLIMQNKANFRKSQMTVNPVKTRKYDNIQPFSRRENKPNSKPIQSQSNPISKQNKPNQTQSKPIFTRDYKQPEMSIYSDFINAAGLLKYLTIFIKTVSFPASTVQEVSVLFERRFSK